MPPPGHPAWAGWDPEVLFGLCMCREPKLGELSTAIFMRNELRGKILEDLVGFFS